MAGGSGRGPLASAWLIGAAAGLAAGLMATSTLAQDAGPAADKTPQDAAQEKPSDRRSFAGIDFGVGISVTMDFGGIDRVEAAELVNGVVRVTAEDDARARIMLESHYFFPGRGDFLGVSADNWGYGPFVAIQPGTDEMIQAAALGVMVGFRRANNQSFNLGIGIAVDPNTRVLGEGLRANQPLPAGETEIRFKEESQYGLVLLTSFSF